MNLKRTLLLLVLVLVQLPVAAFAAAVNDWDTDRCPTPYPLPYPWWWRFDGPRGDIDVRDWNIQQVGDAFDISFSLVNVGAATLEGGLAFTLSHAAVDPAGYREPTSLAPPASARSLLGTEALDHGTLPTLRPGQKVEVRVSARSFTRDATHILTIVFHDGSQIQVDRQSNPWYWLRILAPRSAPGSLALVKSAVEPVKSDLEGYRASRVTLALQNVGRTVIEAGTPISVIHGPSGSAGGYWGPDDNVDPHDPGNPYASFFREALQQTRLERPLYPGEIIELGGVAHEPEELNALQQIVVVAGE
jgi:hypothetical protein